MNLTKADLTDSMYNQVGLPKTKSAQAIDSLLEIIKKTLENGEDVLISGFGKFCVKEKRKRRGRNPQTGEELMLGERRVVIAFLLINCSRESCSRIPPTSPPNQAENLQRQKCAQHSALVHLLGACE